MKIINFIITSKLTPNLSSTALTRKLPTSPTGIYRAIFVFIIGFLLFSGCSKLDLTPVSSPPTGVYHQGKFVWYDLLTNDVANAKKFYGELFGWSFKDQGRYTVVLNRGQAIGGIVKIQPKDKKEHAARWLASLSVPDVDEAAIFVKESGGIIHEGPVEMKNRGRGVLVSDPQGAQVLLMRSSGGDPVDSDPPVGAWLWVELWSNEPEAASAFYEELGNYSVVQNDDGYRFLWQEKWRAGIRPIFDEDLEVRWTPTIRVTDTITVSKLAEKLGGQVLVQPRETSTGDSVALIKDPVGGLLIVQRWSKPSSAAGE